MKLSNRPKDPDTVIRIGLVFLILASLAHWFLRPGANLSEDFTDGATGFLYGVSIGCVLLGLELNRRRRSKN